MRSSRRLAGFRFLLPPHSNACPASLVVETDTWSADNATGLAGQALECGGNKKRKPASRRLEGMARNCDMQYCLDNVMHKSCMGTCVPAHMLVQLLLRCRGWTAWLQLVMGTGAAE